MNTIELGPGRLYVTDENGAQQLIGKVTDISSYEHTNTTTGQRWLTRQKAATFEVHIPPQRMVRLMQTFLSNKRVAHLVCCARKVRTRKKNVRRMGRIFKKEGKP